MKRWLFLLLFIICIFAALVLYAHSKKASLILQAIGIFISSIIAISAIWGEQIRAGLAGPKLELTLDKEEGDLTRFTGGKDIRYYHLRLANKRAGAIAVNTRVLIVSIQRQINGVWGERQKVFGVQLPWVFSDSQQKNIGPEAMCDLASVVDGGDFTLASYIMPNRTDPYIRPSQIVRLETTAVAENAKSNVLALEILWDGKWSKDDEEMKAHLRIREPKRAR